MSETNSQQPDASSQETAAAKEEAAQHVKDRVESWHEGAEKETLREELSEGMDEAGVDVSDREVDDLAEEIRDETTGSDPR